MADKYTLSKSSFIRRDVHQDVDGGVIYERDYTTLGERHVIGSGKKAVSGDGGFLFTEPSAPQRAFKRSEAVWDDPVSQPDVEGSVRRWEDPDRNVATEYGDIRRYCYYGSASELVRVTIERVIRLFPGKVWTDGAYLSDEFGERKAFAVVEGEDGSFSVDFRELGSGGFDAERPGIFVLRNPSGIDFCGASGEGGTRDMASSYGSYYANGRAIRSYSARKVADGDCHEDYDVVYVIDMAFDHALGADVASGLPYYDDYDPDYSSCAEFREEGDDGEHCVSFESVTTNVDSVRIYGIYVSGGIVWCTDRYGMTIVPRPAVIDAYFAGLTGFERVLLDRRTSPLYTASLATVEMDGNGVPTGRITVEDYVFPSHGYCVDFEGGGYSSYVSRLYKMALDMDETWCNNLWNRMTHESIQRFDESYSGVYDGDPDSDYYTGGTKFKKLLLCMGRFFDDMKFLVDGIRRTNVIGGGGSPYSISDAQMSKNEFVGGWDGKRYTTTADDAAVITPEFFEENDGKLPSRWNPVASSGDTFSVACDGQPSWFPRVAFDSIGVADIAKLFSRQAILCAPQIFRSKGTIEGIYEALAMFGLGEEDVEVSERYYKVRPRPCGEEVFLYMPADCSRCNTSRYVHVDGYESLAEYVVSVRPGGVLDGGCEEHIEVMGTNYDLVRMTAYDAAVLLSGARSYDQDYPDDVFSGVPIKAVSYCGRDVLVPYFSQDRLYDGDVVYEGRGGWMKSVEDGEEAGDTPYGYSETVPYMQVVPDCGSLLYIRPADAEDMPYFYVMDIGGVNEFFGHEQQDGEECRATHYFKLAEPLYASRPSGWRSIPSRAEGEDDFGYAEYCNERDEDGMPVRPMYAGISAEDLAAAEYYDSIVDDASGNNPHCGYGAYDAGRMYRDYVERPFRYSVDGGYVPDECARLAEAVLKFPVEEVAAEKAVVCPEDGSEYYMPSKLLVIRKKTGGALMSEYIEKMVFAYLLQVVPSTSIVVFEK